MTTPSSDAHKHNVNRAVTRARRALGKKRQVFDTLQVKRLNREIRKIATRGNDLRTMDESPSMVTLPSGLVKFRPVRPVPRNRGRL